MSTLVRVHANKKVNKPAWKPILKAYEDKWGKPTLGDDVEVVHASDDTSDSSAGLTDADDGT